MSRPLWFVKLIERSYPLRFLAARATRVPGLNAIARNWFFDGDDIICLPPDGTIRIDQTIDVPDSMVLPSQVVEHFIEQAQVHWLMHSCLCRVSNGCEDYAHDLGCLFLGEAALGINPALGRVVSKEEALDHARRCREAGLVHVVGRNKLDSIWLGVGPRDRLLTICNCCPCCCLWGILPHVAPNIGTRVQRMPGLRLHVTDRCVGCGRCTENVCFVQAISLKNGRAAISDACRGCGRCVSICPNGAIELAVKGHHAVDQSIGRIAALVDLS